MTGEDRAHLLHGGSSGEGLGTFRVQRLRWAWLLAPPYLFFAEPSPGVLLGGILISVLGLGLRAWAAGFILKEQELATTGPFRFIRHPLYAGSFLVGMGFAVAGGRWWLVPAFVVLFFWIYRRVLVVEDRTLRRLFGSEYLAYRARVPAFLPTGLAWFGSRPSLRGFSSRRYRRNREWEAALGAAAGFGLLLGKMFLVG